MTRKHACALLLSTSLLPLCGGAQAQDSPWGQFRFNALLRTELAIKTSDDNDYNYGKFDSEDAWANMLAQRGELDINWRKSDTLTGYAKLRAWGDFVNKIDGHYNDNIDLWSNDEFEGDAWTLQNAGDNYIVDVAQAYIDWKNGPLWLRFGKQQIAYGEGIFIQVLDVVNSLDTRRHGAFDVLAEEYADERIGQIGVRGSYSIPQTSWEIEGFVTDFTPGMGANYGSPYNAIPTGFQIYNRDDIEDIRGELIYGGRLRGFLGSVELQFLYVSRPSRNGVLYTVESTATDNDGALGGTPFVHDPESGYGFDITADDPTAGARRLQHDVQKVQLTVERLRNNLHQDYGQKFCPGGVPTRPDFATACLLSATGPGTFLGASTEEFLGHIAEFTSGQDIDEFNGVPVPGFYGTPGVVFPVHGVIGVDYPRENIIGAGANYMITMDPESPLRLLDGVIVRGEASLTLNKKFTETASQYRLPEEDEWSWAMVFEKYHRFTPTLPATFMVLQFWHKSHSDFFDGYRGHVDEDGFNLLGAAVQQNLAGNRWRIDATVSWDMTGSWYLQPGVRWKPREDWQFDVYYNYFAGDNDSTFGRVDDFDEAFLRVSKYF